MAKGLLSLRFRFEISAPEGSRPLNSPLAGLITQIKVKEGDKFKVGQEIALLESMKMEHVVKAESDGTVKKVNAEQGSSINEGEAIVFFIPSEGKSSTAEQVKEDEEDASIMRPDLEEIIKLRKLQTNEARSDAFKRRKDAGFLTARDNIALLIDKDSFIEWGDFNIAAQRTRIDEEELRERTSNDGVITGWANVNGTLFKKTNSASIARCALCIYDYMVLTRFTIRTWWRYILE